MMQEVTISRARESVRVLSRLSAFSFVSLNEDATLSTAPETASLVLENSCWIKLPLLLVSAASWSFCVVEAPCHTQLGHFLVLTV